MRIKWFDTEEDPDRKRRKQAEFLIKNELSIQAIPGIAVYNEKALDIVNNTLKDHLITMKTVIMPNWYY